MPIMFSAMLHRIEEARRWNRLYILRAARTADLSPWELEQVRNVFLFKPSSRVLKVVHTP